MAEQNFDEKFQQVLSKTEELEQRIEALEHTHGLSVQHIVLTTPDDHFRINIRLERYQLSATPMVKVNGEWKEGPAAGINARWQVRPDGTIVHFSST
jgi:hypothetical protein